MKNYFVAMATYSFGFGGKKIYVANSKPEALDSFERMNSQSVTNFEIIEVTAPNKKAAAEMATAGKSMFAGAFAGCDIQNIRR